jgi:hypothetical protein
MAKKQSNMLLHLHIHLQVMLLLKKQQYMKWLVNKEMQSNIRTKPNKWHNYTVGYVIKNWQKMDYLYYLNHTMQSF